MKYFKSLLFSLILIFSFSITVNAESLSDLTSKLEAQTKEIDSLNNKIIKNTEEIIGLEANLKSIESNLNQQYDDMKLRIKYLYENGNEKILETFLESGNISEFINDITYKDALMNYDRKKLNEIQKNYDDLMKKKKELEKEKNNLEKLKKENEDKKQKLEKLINDKKEELKKEQSKIKIANSVINTNTEITYKTANNYGYSDQQLDLICAIVAQESCSDYDGSLAVITCAMNRCDAPQWQYNGLDPLSQLCANGQFTYSIDGRYISRLNGNYPDFVKQAVLDCLNGKRNHNFLSFRGYAGNGSNTCIGGNWYF